MAPTVWETAGFGYRHEDPHLAQFHGVIAPHGLGAMEGPQQDPRSSRRDPS
jgi:hypothetical protein